MTTVYWRIAVHRATEWVEEHGLLLGVWSDIGAV